MDSLQEKIQLFNQAFPQCRRLIPADTWQLLVARTGAVDRFADKLEELAAELQLPEYLAELARLEAGVFSLAGNEVEVPEYSDKLSINPSLLLFENSWQNLAHLLHEETAGPSPSKGAEHVIAWRHPISGTVKARAAGREDLLALKMTLEELSVPEVAQQGGVSAAVIQAALIMALQDGIVSGPEPRIKRHYNPNHYEHIDRSYFAARIFSLQWHITQTCDLHCRHCYDRGQYKALTLPQELAILDEMANFCRAHNVHGQITFTGGNPLLHPRFEILYQEAAARGFTLAILGNPTTPEQIERLNAIQPLAFYQVSLEGLEEHNDYMRGKGHFRKILTFLEVLRKHAVYSMVMLTLTRANMDQVLPLAEILRNRADLFTFNRLSLVGEGANLVMVDAKKYPGFLREYAGTTGNNPCLGVKDNLLNIVYREKKLPLFGGCTGFGCGAAFNFITVLADGAVHACRKFPSPLGNILDNSLGEIYHSEIAERYRRGAVECSRCSIRPVCGGCLAVAHSHELDIFRQKDPYCFLDSEDFSV